MPRLYLTVLFTISFLSGWTQARIHSLGIFTGITSSYTYDAGISKDQRYQEQYNIKLAPIGISYGLDFEDVGFLISPGVSTIGQNFYVVNTTGGQEGMRKINLQYLNIPVACKFKIIDLSFFRISGLGAVSAGYVLNGKETVSHNNTKLKFVDEIVPPVLPPTYVRQYDGVLSPAVKEYSMLTKNDFNPLQFFVSAGLRSDWDVDDQWRISFDLRANYGLLEPRKTAYLNELNAYQKLYDLPGARRDMFMQLSIGIARYFEIEKKGSGKKKTIKSSPGKRSHRNHR